MRKERSEPKTPTVPKQKEGPDAASTLGETMEKVQCRATRRKEQLLDFSSSGARGLFFARGLGRVRGGEKMDDVAEEKEEEEEEEETLLEPSSLQGVEARRRGVKGRWLLQTHGSCTQDVDGLVAGSVKLSGPQGTHGERRSDGETDCEGRGDAVAARKRRRRGEEERGGEEVEWREERVTRGREWKRGGGGGHWWCVECC